MHPLPVVHVQRDGVDWLLIAVTPVALALAIFEAFRSGSLAKAARRAVERALRHVRAQELSAMAPKFTSLQVELEQALDAKDKGRLLANIIEWHSISNELIGMIGSDGSAADQELLSSLQRLATIAAHTQTQVAESSTVVRSHLKALRQLAIDVKGHLNRHSGSLRTEPPKD